MIESSEFGRMVIDGIAYTSDLIIYPDGRVRDSWWRMSGHRLTGDDIAGLLTSGCRVIVAGTGVNGFMRPDENLGALLEDRGIKFIAEPTPKAVRTYNSFLPQGGVGACFHLTC